MGDPHELLDPPGQSPRHLIARLIVTIVSGFVAVVLFFVTLLAANPCGAFGDACDDYGAAPTDFFVMLALTLLAIVAFVVGLVLVVRGFSRRN
jgi:uncharacterized RDD family membrane protein YckC